ncbi:hypothetical protein WUBG_04143, partial [Wuchereria bancrofti]
MERNGQFVKEQFITFSNEMQIHIFTDELNTAYATAIYVQDRRKETFLLPNLILQPFE